MAGKGSAFEREFAGMLGQWWAGDENIFWRTSNSGGRATTRAKTGKKTNSNQHGDIGYIDLIGKDLLDVFTIELKRGYKNAICHDLLDRSDSNKQSIFESFLQQVTDSSKDAGTPCWLLVTRRDRRECVVWMPTYVYNWFERRDVINSQLPRIRFDGSFRRTKKVKEKTTKQGKQTYKTTTIADGESPHISVSGILLKDFFECVTRKHVKKLQKFLERKNANV